jgi:hypothetical protein
VSWHGRVEVKGGSVPASGISINYTIDGNPASVLTDSAGRYQIQGIEVSSDVVVWIDTALYSDYVVTPDSYRVDDIATSVVNANFLLDHSGYVDISGTVSFVPGASMSVVGLLVNYSGSVSGTAYTDVAGQWSIANVPVGSSLVITVPDVNGYLTPDMVSLNDLSQDVDNVHLIYVKEDIKTYVVTGFVSVTGGSASASGRTVNYSIDDVAQSSLVTSADGSYAIPSVPSGSKLVISVPALSGYVALPENITIDTVSSSLSDKNFVYISSDSGDYTVTGRVLVDGGALSVAGRTVNYTVGGVGGVAGVAITDVNGDYVIAGIPFGSDVVLTPAAEAGYTVSPAVSEISSLRDSARGYDFVYAIIPDDTISWFGMVKVIDGTLSPGGIIVHYSIDGVADSVLTDSDGRYTIKGLTRGSAVVAWIDALTYPAYTITPDSIRVDIILTSVVKADFLLDDKNSVSVSGTISFSPNGSMSVAGRQVDYSGSIFGSVYTDAAGQWTIPNVPVGGSLVLTVPEISGYVSPDMVSLTDIIERADNVHLIYIDNASKTYVITGFVSVTGGTMSAAGLKIPYTVNGVSDTVYTRADGSYTIFNLPYMSDVVITPPVIDGYEVSPEEKEFLSITDNKTLNIVYVEISLLRYTISGLVYVVNGDLRSEEVVINYSINGVEQPAAEVYESGNYLIKFVPYKARVVLTPEQKANYIVSPSEVVFDSVVDFNGDVTFVYTYTGQTPPDPTNPFVAGITVNDISLLPIADTMEYTLPCGGDTVVITVSHDTNMYCVGGDVIVDDVRTGAYTKTYLITVVNPNASGDTSKVYVLRIKKRFELYDIVEERYNNALVVINNPSVNGGYSFSEYTWYRSETKDGLGSVIGTKQYYSAGPYEDNLLNEEMYYYVVLREATLGIEQTCPDRAVLRGDARTLGVYPNPAPSRNKIYVTGLEGYDGGATVSVFDMQGRVAFSGRVSDIWGGVYAPERTGAYLLRVVAENGVSKTVKFVVK